MWPWPCFFLIDWTRKLIEYLMIDHIYLVNSACGIARQRTPPLLPLKLSHHHPVAASGIEGETHWRGFRISSTSKIWEVPKRPAKMAVSLSWHCKELSFGRVLLSQSTRGVLFPDSGNLFDSDIFFVKWHQEKEWKIFLQWKRVKKAFTFWTATGREMHKSKKAPHVDLLTSTY